MKVFQDAWSRSDLPKGAVATIGNYDGVHRGQRKILDVVVARARALERPAAVVTFSPHPTKILWPHRAPRCLTTPAQKERLLALASIGYLFVVRFDAVFAATPADQFVTSFLHGRLGLHELHVGKRFAFGKGREGDLELLQSLGGDACPALGVDEVVAGGAAISSTRIREAVATGRVDVAEWMLGRPYEITGTVARGAGKGRELGWPTINVAHENELIPAHGVYITLVRTPGADGGEVLHPSVSNVGVRPTVHDESTPTVESHLLDFEGDLYGQAASIGFLARLRGEERFPSLDALRSQIGADVRAAREHFGGLQTRAISVV
ncbi:MAG: riboflavin biosynthesis protein RibF [Thermoanaerobaculia bacterium]